MSSKSIWIILWFLAFLWALWWWFIFFNQFVLNSTVQKYEDQKKSNNELNNEIDQIWNATSKELNERLTFYEDYFQKKSEMFILEIFWLIEYSLPDNNFVQSISLSKNESEISLDFSSPNIEDLLKLYRNLEKVKELWIITEYSLETIELDWEEWLKSTEMKKYRLNIWLSPNVTSWNEQIIEFLKKYDPYYRWIYTTTLKKIYCDLYTNDDWKEFCKTDEMIAKEKKENEENEDNENE